MFGQIAPTPYDLRFSLLGIPVRVHPSFWIAAALLGWVPQRLDLTFVWVLCVFASILVHEFGHAIVTRAFGWSGEIVLFYLGGYATTGRYSTWRSIAVSFAGPAAGFLFALLIFLLLTAQALFRFQIENPYVIAAIAYLISINIFWGLLNLLPVLPLDGGRISSDFCQWVSPRSGWRVCLVISMVVGGGLAALAAYFRQIYIAVMFGYMAFESYQMYQAERRGYW
jgi:stage IV sporulation protein FB